MDDFFTLIVVLVLLVLAAPILAIIALVRTSGVNDRLYRLERRMAALETGPATAATPRTAGPTPQSAAPPAPPPPATPAEPSQAAQPATPPQPSPPSQPVLTPQPAPQPVAASVPASPVPSTAPSSATPAAAHPPRNISFEERFGTRWVVWVGGIALALGGIFLVRYAIEQDLIGPRVRVMLGALLALALVGAGEWQRRSERALDLPNLPTADIPAILTAAGTTVAYATVYAAYALYGFLAPPIAFVLLGAVALLCLAAALLHGPALAGLGVVGAYLAPMLVASNEPDYWALYIYIAVVNAAAFALARYRLWRWLALSALVLGALWAVPGVNADFDSVTALGAHVFHAVTGFALVAVFLVCGSLYGPPSAPGEIDHVSALALSVYLLVGMLLVLASRHDATALIAFVILTVAAVAIAWRTEAATAAVPVTALFAAAVMAHWATHMQPNALLAPSGPTAPAIPEPGGFDYGWHFALAALWAALFGGAGFLAQGRSERPLVPMLWAASGVILPLAMLIALYYRIAALDRSLPFAGLALLLAALYGVATEALVRREPRPGLMEASAMFATATMAALALALTFALEKGWLTIALALMVPGTAWVAGERPLPWLRWLAAILAGVVAARITHEPRIAGDDVGTTPIFNWLLYGYGVPAASCWFAGRLLRKRADDEPAHIVDAAAILFTVLLVVMEIRHYVTGGNIYAPMRGPTEIMLYANAALAMTIGLEHIRARSGSFIHNAAASIMAALTAAAVLADLIVGSSLQFISTPLPGGPFINEIMLGFGLPAVLAIILALIARRTRPIPYRTAAAIAAVLLALYYLTLETRRLFHGPILAGPTSDAEQYAYSTVWLVYGIVLLAAGFVLRSQPARLLALGVIILTIAKVFLYDTSNIAGIYRALSAIGLGVVLLGIGWLYQRVLYPQTAAREGG
ncbi:MAG TPA: DUF2339 domain-containing protein [Xanthobacteraceae bacterium]|nr:DUF2339 domain-containing protein [Xanthobacteraceae bacterium]